MSDRIVRVGVIGLGRSGWDIHVNAFGQMADRYKVVAMHDTWAERLNTSAAEVGAKPYEALDAFLKDADIDLVVVASPNKFHFDHAIAALNAGKHVLCDKPFGTCVAQVDQMIGTAKRNGVVLQPFQQRRYESDFQKILEILDAGTLGTLQFARICWHGFKRRWDWQTMPEMNAGELYNNGPHPVDHAMFLLGDSDATPVRPTVWAERRKCLTSGDGEDHVKIILTAPRRPTIEIEISSVFAFGQDRWTLCGTAGGLRGSANELEWKWVDWSTMPARPLDPKSTPDRSYNTEKLDWQTGSWKPASAADTGGGAVPSLGPVAELYTMLHGVVTDGAAQTITPQSVRRRVDILERAAAMAPVIR